MIVEGGRGGILVLSVVSDRKLELGEAERFGRELIGLNSYMTYGSVSIFSYFLLSTIEKHRVSMAISLNKNRESFVLGPFGFWKQKIEAAQGCVHHQILKAYS